MNSRRIHNRKKRALIVTSSVMVISSVAPSIMAATNFTDISKNTHREAILALADRNIVKGYPDNTFKPSKALTRADVVKMLGKFLVEQYDHTIPSDYATKIRFTDIKNSENELKKYAAVVYDTGIFIGSNGKLDPKSLITRENIALVLDRLVMYLTEVNTAGYVLSKGEPSIIKDLNKAKSESRTPIKTIEYYDLTVVEQFRPKESTTRGQFASFLYRLLMNVLENDAVLEDMENYKWSTKLNLDSIVVGVINNQLMGSGVSGLKVTIKDINGQTLGSGTVNSDGTLALNLSRPLVPNEELTLTLTDGVASKDITYVVPKEIIPPNEDAAKTSLNNALTIANQTAVVAVSTDGNDISSNEQWTTANEKAAFENAKAAAQQVYNDNNATEQQLEDATAALIEAISNYNGDKKQGTGEEQPQVDFSALTSKLAEANSVIPAIVSVNGSDVSPSNKWVTQAEQNAFNAAKQTAASVLANTSSTQQQVDEVVTALNTAITNYINAMEYGTQGSGGGGGGGIVTPPTVDKSALQAQLTAANNVVAAAISSDGTDVPYGDKWVTQSEQDDFNNVKADAQSVFSNPNATTQQVANAAAALQAAIDAYNAAKEDGTLVDKTALQTAIDAANATNTAIRSTNGTNVPTTQKWVRPYEQDVFKSAIDAANDVLADPAATPQEVTDAIQALQAATNIYEAAKKDGLLVDVTTLNALITDAELVPLVPISNVSGVDIATTDKWVTQQENDDFLAAIQDAKAVLANPTTPQAVAAAVTDLESAIESYEAAKKDGLLVDRSDLEDAIVAAQTTPQAIVAPNGSNIPPGTKWVSQAEQDAFDSALADAISVYDDSSSNDDDIAAATQTLNDAIAVYIAAQEDGTYVAPVDKTALSDAIVQANSVTAAIISSDGEDVISTSKWVTPVVQQQFDDAKAAAQQVFDDPNATATDVSDAVSALTAAITAYDNAKDDGLKASQAEKDDLLAALTSADTVELVIVAPNGSMIPLADKWVDPTEDAAFQAAKLAAQNVYNNPGALVTEVTAAISDLNAAIATYNAGKEDGKYVAPPDRTNLQAAIASADATVIAIISTDGNNINPGDKWTSQQAYDDFIATKNAAQTVYTNPNATQQQIDDAETTLVNAITAYNNAKQDGSTGNAELKEDLAALITQANEELTLFISVDGKDVQPVDNWVTDAEQDAFEQAIAAALEIYNTVPATNVEVLDAITELQKAIDVHEPKPGIQATPTEKADLYAALQAANTTTPAVVSPNGLNVNPGTDWVTPAEQQAFNDEKAAAQEVFNDPKASGDEVTAAITALNNAIDVYEDAKKDGLYQAPPDKTALQNAIASADSVVLVTVANNGENVPDTAQWVTQAEQRAFNEAKAAANTVFNNPDATAQQIADATEALNDAIAAYEAAKEDGLFVDRSALSAKIAEAAAIPLFRVSIDGSDVLLGNPWVTAAEQQAFTDAKAAAQAVFNDPDASSQDISAAVTALQAAMDAYDAADDPGTMQPDKSALQAAYNDLTSMSLAPVSVDGTEIDSAKDWIAQADLEAFTDALDDANTVLQDSTATQATIDAAKVVLEQALAAYNDALKSGTKPIVNTVNLSYENNKVTQLTEINGVKTNESTRRTSFISGQGILTSTDISFTGDDAPPLFFEVADGEELDIRILMEHASLVELGNFEVALYKLNADGSAYEKVTGTEQSYSVVGAGVGAIGFGVQSQDEFEFNNIGPGEYIVLSVVTLGGSLFNVTDTTLLQANLTQTVEAQNAAAGPISGVIELGSQSTVTNVTPTKAGTAAVSVSSNNQAVIIGEHGTLRMSSNGQYTYETQGNLDDIGKVDEFTFTVQNGANSTTHKLYIRHDLEGQADALIWANNNLPADAVLADALSIEKTATVATSSSDQTLSSGTSSSSTLITPYVYNDAGLTISGRDSKLSFKIHATNTLSFNTDGTYEVRDKTTKIVYYTGSFTKNDHGQTISVTNLPAGTYEIAFKRSSATGTFGVQSATISNVNWIVDGAAQLNSSLPVTSNTAYDPAAEIFISLGSKLKIDGAVLADTDTKLVQGLYGTLELAADGSYTYNVNRDLLRAAYVNGKKTYTEQFDYSIISPNGIETDDETITIKLEMLSPPTEVNAGATVVPTPVGPNAYITNDKQLRYTLSANVEVGSTVDATEFS